MNRLRSVVPLVIALFVLIGVPASFAQVNCPTLPGDSPVLSNSPDDIPATNTDVLTYTGAYAKLGANHNFAFVEFNSNEQRVWFAPDGTAGVFYNRRYRADANSPWYWQYSVSPVVTNQNHADPSSGGPTSVLYSATPKYVDNRNGEVYEYLMVQNWQPSSCNGASAGFIFITYSHDGICWTSSRQMIGATAAPACYPWLTSPVQVEQVSAIDDGTEILFFYVEGSINLLAPADKNQRNTNMDRTQTYVNFSFYNAPQLIYSYRIKSELSTAGMFDVGYAYDRSNPRRYYAYRYFMNLHTAWDAANGDFYIGRAYPYPYDRQSLGSNDLPTGDTTPTPDQRTEQYILDQFGHSVRVGGCLSSPFTLPNRMQIYKMHIGTLSNITAITTGTWTLVSDIGHNAGYGNTLNGLVPTTPLLAGQSNFSRDWAAPSFLRDSVGSLMRYSGTAYFFGGDTFELSKSHDRCYVTGLERETLLTLP